MRNDSKTLVVRRTAFIGHRNFLPRDIEQRLAMAIHKEIALGCINFMVGTHGDFDRAALRVCKSVQKICPAIKIQVVVTTLPSAQPDLPPAPNVERVMFEVEELHYKQRIIASNRQMVAACDTLIGYVRPQAWRSGAKTTMNYARKKGLKIVNLYTPADG